MVPMVPAMALLELVEPFPVEPVLLELLLPSGPRGVPSPPPRDRGKAFR